MDCNVTPLDEDDACSLGWSCVPRQERTAERRFYWPESVLTSRGFLIVNAQTVKKHFPTTVLKKCKRNLNKLFAVLWTRPFNNRKNGEKGSMRWQAVTSKVGDIAKNESSWEEHTTGSSGWCLNVLVLQKWAENGNRSPRRCINPVFNIDKLLPPHFRYPVYE